MAELGLFTVALPARYAQLAAPDQAVRAELAVLGLSPGRYALYQVALDTIFVVVFATIGGLIFLRKPGDPVALLVALMLCASRGAVRAAVAATQGSSGGPRLQVRP